MSGFFMIRASVAHAVVPRLSGVGFKILLDIMASADRPLRHLELPYEFGSRRAGESKLDSKVAWDYLVLLSDKTVGRFVPIRFVLFSLVGGAGVVVHLAALWILFEGLGLSFVVAQSGAAVVAMTANFLVNNEFTYRDQRLRGLGLARGWLSFVAACGVGAAANVGVASYLFAQHSYWVLSAVAGIAIGAVWNYAVTSIYTWRGAAR
jgi:dolichol-phosphate mannosyltransferase